MTKEFDPKRSYLAIKANEKMIAYVGFLIRFDGDGQSKEGVIKISSFHRPYGGGYLSLTFIVDTKDNEELKDHLNSFFDKLTEDSLKPYFGDELDKIVKVSLDSLEEVHDWYIEEVSVHFRSIDERENVLIEEKLIPALACILPFTFDPVEWWPTDKPVEVPAEVRPDAQISLKMLFKKWFKAD
jgi:hypothetical protein